MKGKGIEVKKCRGVIEIKISMIGAALCAAIPSNACWKNQMRRIYKNHPAPKLRDVRNEYGEPILKKKDGIVF